MNILDCSITVESILITFNCSLLSCISSTAEVKLFFKAIIVCLETLKEMPFLWKEFQVKHHHLSSRTMQQKVERPRNKPQKCIS